MKRNKNHYQGNDGSNVNRKMKSLTIDRLWLGCTNDATITAITEINSVSLQGYISLCFMATLPTTTFHRKSWSEACVKVAHSSLMNTSGKRPCMVSVLSFRSWHLTPGRSRWFTSVCTLFSVIFVISVPVWWCTFGIQKKQVLPQWTDGQRDAGD